MQNYFSLQNSFSASFGWSQSLIVYSFSHSISFASRVLFSLLYYWYISEDEQTNRQIIRRDRRRSRIVLPHVLVDFLIGVSEVKESSEVRGTICIVFLALITRPIILTSIKLTFFRVVLMAVWSWNSSFSTHFLKYTFSYLRCIFSSESFFWARIEEAESFFWSSSSVISSFLLWAHNSFNICLLWDLVIGPLEPLARITCSCAPSFNTDSIYLKNTLVHNSYGSWVILTLSK